MLTMNFLIEESNGCEKDGFLSWRPLLDAENKLNKKKEKRPKERRKKGGLV